MKFLVDKMPLSSDECPFFHDKVCKLNTEKCDFFSDPYDFIGETIYYHDSFSRAKCYHLKALESEDTE